MNARFQIAVHILTLLDQAAGEKVSSDYIAGSINTNPALVRKEIGNLRKHGLIDSKEGKGGGYLLAKPAAVITLADIYSAVKSKSFFGHSKNEPNPACAVGRQINVNINELYHDIDGAVVKKLSAITLEKFSKKFN